MKRRKLLSLLLALCMTFGLTACGGSKTTEESSGDSGSAGESGGDTITIGMIGPLTGSLAVYGTHVQAGVELAIEEINAAGGVTLSDSATPAISWLWRSRMTRAIPPSASTP